MYFWKIKNLKNDILTNKLTEKDCAIYLALEVLLQNFFAAVSSYQEATEATTVNISFSIIYFFITFLFLVFAYQINGGKGGKDFLAKYLSINFVVGLRISATLVPLAIIIFTFIAIISNTNPYETNLPFHILSTAIIIIIYWRVCKHISDIRTEEEKTERQIAATIDQATAS